MTSAAASKPAAAGPSSSRYSLGGLVSGLLLITLVAGVAVVPQSADGTPMFGKKAHPTACPFGTLFTPAQLLAQHCHAPTPLATQYAPVPGKRHITSLLFIRHGDRTPNVLMPDESDMTYTCDTVESYSEEIPRADGQGLAGTRAQTYWSVQNPDPSVNPNSKDAWRGNCMSGQLTDVGARQHVLLGQELGKIYDISSSSQIVGRSTVFWRTRQSAQSVISGVLTRKDVDKSAPIMIKVMAPEIENMVPMVSKCPRVKHLHHNNDGKDRDFSTWWSHQAHVRDTFDAVMGTSTTHGGSKSGTLEKYFDSIHTRACHNHPDLRNQAGVSVSQATKDQIIVEGNCEILYQYKTSPHAQEFIRLVLGNFLKEIIGEMEETAKHPSKWGTKLHIYSGHDTTISPLLGSLLLPDEMFYWPPYASNILFEMWTETEAYEPDSPFSSFIVRVLYNGEVIPLSWCGGAELCPLAEFVSYYKDNFIPESTEQYFQECNKA